MDDFQLPRANISSKGWLSIHPCEATADLQLPGVASMPLSLRTVRTQLPITVREADLTLLQIVMKRLSKLQVSDLLCWVFSIKHLTKLTGQMFLSGCLESFQVDYR